MSLSSHAPALLRAELQWERLATTPRAIQRLLRRCLKREPSERLHDIADARIEIVEAMAAPEGDDPTRGAVAKACDLDQDGKVDRLRNALQRDCVDRELALLIKAIPTCGVSNQVVFTW